MALLSTLSLALRNLLSVIGFSYTLQAAVAVPSIYFQSDCFYDLSGSLTYIGCTLFSLYLPTLRSQASVSSQGLPKPNWPGLNSFHPRQLISSVLTLLLAARLGNFLFGRVLESGGDSRFDKIKKHPERLAVALVSLPVLAINSVPASALPKLSTGDLIGLSIWILGFLTEVTADHRAKGLHKGDLITKGLWGKSRHPNYAGETTLWTGRIIGGLMSLASPMFTYFLLARKYRGRKDYQEWKRNTPVFWPKLF
ncbi:hypothetical protein L873DRAFT_1826589 [Choiromyces venosus 120613-1]|uniref:DUF1295-domain-containing protein n=1 Tax=Choiromyces venosus 120613-1 TaxID=1336337 RepID=A0A3N4JVZ1_9PEZI|nr:hypothetical protein L873DRAFT_1826589 [Choiromyces venosus 120613-1]